MDFVDETESLICLFAKDGFDGGGLRFIVQMCGRAMSIDVLNLQATPESCICQRKAHRANRTPRHFQTEPKSGGHHRIVPYPVNSHKTFAPRA